MKNKNQEQELEIEREAGIGCAHFKPLILICPSLTTMNLPSALFSTPLTILNNFAGSVASVLNNITPLVGFLNRKINSPKSLSSVIITKFSFSANNRIYSSGALRIRLPTNVELYPWLESMRENLLPRLSSTRNLTFFMYYYREYFFTSHKALSIEKGSFDIFFCNVRVVFQYFIKSHSISSPAYDSLDCNSSSLDYRLSYHHFRVYYNSLHEVFFHNQHHSFMVYKTFAQK